MISYPTGTSIRLFAVALAAAALLSSPTLAQVARGDSGAITPPILETGRTDGGPITLVGAEAPQSKTPATAAPAAAPVQTVAVPQGEGTLQAYGDWSTQCYDEAIGGLRCQMLQRVVAQSGQAVLVVALAADPRAKVTNLQVALPLGVSLLDGAQLMVGDTYQSAVQISRCTQQGCIIEGTMTDTLLDAMKKGQTAAVIVFNESKKQIPISFSLKGFTDAYAAMLSANG
jgi:invasion protein IalB